MHARAAAPACPACASQDCRHYTTHKAIELFACGRCDTVFMFPMPTFEEVEEKYDDCYDGATSGYFSKVGKKLKRSRGRMAFLSRFAKGGRFLDVGCNGGFMVEAAREHGFEAHGLDLDRVSIAYARETYPRNSYFHGSVEAFAEEERARFDLVYCSEVIEHVPDANSFVAAIAGLLRPRGLLFVTTPDISHWRRPHDLTNWDGFNPPAHCIYFNPKSLTALLARHGLTVVKRRFAFKPGIKLLARKA